MILVTGAAGFIGFHVAEALLARGDVVLGTETGCGDAEGFWSGDGRAWRVVSHPPVVGLATFECSVTDGLTATDQGFVAAENHKAVSAGVLRVNGLTIVRKQPLPARLLQRRHVNASAARGRGLPSVCSAGE